jgi:hypothetical protein
MSKRKRGVNHQGAPPWRSAPEHSIKNYPRGGGYFLRLRTTGMHLCFGVLARGARIQLSAI